ncbi:LytTR family transcriptional regulator DNA-binding domain-containing protein [Kordia sp.]|uniref:LytTR family transcriptional regulator DNA-binding domain-containing protein n=1 Tax=Kordia sp. TaxID=1965332 RepID=UPI0025C61099|nr:LytTR family transcriptional regulator DNA-binding domain-containing protein [Kordia sp.]MCH2192941.1 LytTR family transcriptional regulator DNA-binding domain-containing protein [Kordia sp.]
MQIQNFYIQSIPKQLLIGFFIGLWLFLFLYFVEPFDMYQLRPNERTFASLGYSVVGVLTYSLLIPVQYLLYNIRKSWSWLHESAMILSLLILSGITSYLFFKFVLLPNEPNTYKFGFFFSQRVIPTMFLVLPVMIFLRWMMGDKTVVETKTETKESTIVIKGENKAEVLHIKESELVFIESANNYVRVFYLLDGKLKSELFRNKISVLQKEFPFLLKTHRSFLIHPIHFLEWKRESSQTILILKPETIEIPVSKTYKKTLVEKFINPAE